MRRPTFAGGQCAWYLRPFFGPSTIRDIPFIEGSAPDYRGATSFYEAVYHLIHPPPPLPEGYFNRRRTRARSERLAGSGAAATVRAAWKVRRFLPSLRDWGSGRVGPPGAEAPV